MKQCLATLCTLSLLASQRGFFISEAWAAQTASVVRTNAAPANAGAAAVSGAAALPLPLQMAPMGLTLTPTLDLVSPQPVLAAPVAETAVAAEAAAVAQTAAVLFQPAVEAAREDDRALSRGSAASEALGAASARGQGEALVAPPSSPLPGDADPGRVVFDGSGGDRYSVLLTRDGKDPVLVPLSRLSALLAANPEALESLNAEGKLRVVATRGGLAGLLTEADAERMADLLAQEHGVRAQLQVETVPIDWKGRGRTGPEVEEGPAGPLSQVLVRTAALGGSAALGWMLAAWILGMGAAPLLFWGAAAALTVAVYGALDPVARELRFLGRTLLASMTWPTSGEVIFGLGTKGPGFALNVFVWLAAIGTGHPEALAAAIGLSLFLETFHGLWLNSWNNFQDNLQKLRGATYQVFFNWTYFQIPGAIFRALSWHAAEDRSKIVPPWDFFGYWIQQIGLMSVLGTVFGTLGTRGLNDLYNNGRINRWQRSMIDQFKSLMFLLVGMLFSPGSDKLLFGFIPMFYAFVAIFIFQQTLDATLYLMSTMAKKRTILYVVDAAVAETKEFHAKYVAPALPPKHSAFMEVLYALAGIPFILPFVLLGRWVVGRFRGGPKKEDK